MTRKITLFLLFLLLLPAVVFAQPTFINPTSGVITSPFGWRIHPITGASRFHSGIDIAEDYYTPVVASAPGVVTHAGWIDGYGNAVIIEHEGGWSTLYGHFEETHVTGGADRQRGASHRRPRLYGQLHGSALPLRDPRSERHARRSRVDAYPYRVSINTQ